MTARTDVVIVGYGPVGQTLAALLGARGRRVTVFEKQPEPYPMPRAVHIDHEVARILQGAGIGQAIGRLSEPADAYEWRNATGDVLLQIGSKEMGLSGWPEGNMIAQPDLERELDAHVRTLPSVTVARGVEVVGVTQDAAGARVTVADLHGTRREVEAAFVVGCDGANSFVRRGMQATVTDLGFFFDWLIVDVVPHVPRVWNPLNVQICDPARPTTLVSGGPGRRRWEFMRLPGESIAELDDEATAWRLLAPWDVTPANARLERHTVYTFQARWVDGWRDGRLLLAGDAAHQMPPFAGQGMCSGIRDAANLAWKLDLVLGGAAPLGLLDTYAAERVPQVRQVVEFSIELGKVICVPDPAAAAARDAAMTAAARANGLTPPLPAPAIGAGITLAGDALAGHLAPQGVVAVGERRGRFDDVVGDGWLLVSPVGDAMAHVDPDVRAFFADLGGRSVHVAAEGPVEDVDGTYRRWFATHGAAVVLQRPDFHVFGTAASLDDATALVRRLRDMLAAPPAA